MMMITDTSDPSIKQLRSKITQIMRVIRAQTPPLASPDLAESAKGSEIWEGFFAGESIKRVVIYLRSSGCSWAMKTSPTEKPIFKAGCLDCEHSVAGTTLGVPISAATYVKQFEKEFIKYHDFQEYPMLCVYNEGSMFNEAELPAQARRDILKIIAENTHIKSVILESLPEYITERVLDETRTILGDRHLEIGVGLESSNPLVRHLCINKPFTLQQFEKTAQLINRYCHLLSYILVKPSFLTEMEALQDSLKTVQYAFDVGSRVVSIEPLNIGEFAISGALSRLGLYRVPWLWTVLEIAHASHKLGETRLGGYQFAPKYENYAQNCPLCTMKVKEAIMMFNATNDITHLSELTCSCQDEWREELTREHPQLVDRVWQHVDKLSKASLTPIRILAR